MHILLIEDDTLVASGILAGLRLHAMTVDHVASARLADEAVRLHTFDIVILDLGLPDEDGNKLLSRWRSAGQDFPVLVLTARDAIEDRILGLRTGADDYVIKPFDLNELVARLHALYRRMAGRSVDEMRYGELTLDPSSYRVTFKGENIDLSRREILLLQTLLNAPDQIHSLDKIRSHLYGLDDLVESNAINVHVHHLRRKLEPGIIETVRGVGFRLGRSKS